MNSRFLFTLLMISTATAFASNSPYTGEQLRAIKALSEAEITSLLEGKGMGLAKAAELNHYPGPKHVLVLATELDLSSDQISASTKIFEQMEAEAIRLGSEIVRGEATLDSLFAQNNITPEELDRQLAAIGRARAELRGVHLKAHFAQRAVLTPHQVFQYDELRGYADGTEGHSHSDALHNE